MIPPRIHITAKATYEVLWTESFKDPKQYGECDPQARTITILLGLSPEETFWTFFHEVNHAITFEGDRDLWEKDVRMLERSWRRIAELNKVENGFLNLFQSAHLPPPRTLAGKAMRKTGRRLSAGRVSHRTAAKGRSSRRGRNRA